MKRNELLIIDDDESFSSSLQDYFQGQGFGVSAAFSKDETLIQAAKKPLSLIFLDQRLPDGEGIELVKRLHEMQPDALIIFMTAYASIEMAVRAVKEGAFDYIAKPFDLDQLDSVVNRAMQARTLLVTRACESCPPGKFKEQNTLVGSSKVMTGLKKQISLIASNPDIPVLLYGETGTGKEIVARSIHLSGPNARGPFVPVNCGALPEQLVESELFGHAKGSFTGAAGKHSGAFELASGGTLFLDEITELPVKLQSKLLRAVEQRSFFPVGGEKEFSVTERIIAATNRLPETAIQEGDLRRDLYYRLSAFTIIIPPLRERTEDIPELIRHFILARVRPSHAGKFLPEPEEEQRLKQYSWPGNVRELKNIVERAIILGLSKKMSQLLPRKTALRARYEPAGGQVRPESDRFPKLEDLVDRHIRAALVLTNNNKTRAAQLLGISIATLRRRLKEMHGWPAGFPPEQSASALLAEHEKPGEDRTD